MMKPDRIDAYLAKLGPLLRASPRDNARLLLEAAAHLRDVEAAARAAGVSPEHAADLAIARFGPAERVAEEAARNVKTPQLWVRLGVHATRLGAVVLAALGLNGLLGEPLSWALGMDFFFGDERRVAVSPERCEQLLRLQPGQSTCNGALVEHHFGEYVEYGLVALLLGALLLWAARAWRFRLEPVGPQRTLLELATLLAAVVLFALGALVDLPRGLLGTMRDPHLGAGRALSQGLVCALGAVLFAVLAVRRMRTGADAAPAPR
jgi:hypothetical protein